ncbi:phosphoribosyl-ATP pyrophosphohydrolase [Candidatus Dependentiae bacterium]|nr:phosphoribosyl-ATP pyrophosphohydrolase [Candidatus Dependentiae bacterium]
MIKEKIFNKLIRDNIPQILKNRKVRFTAHILSGNDFLKELNNKLDEEINEYLQAKNKTEALEELADILEVIKTILRELNISYDELEEIRLKKLNINGGFSKKIFLEKICENK